jgi:uncharacterized coiled-coil protein SlyX
MRARPLISTDALNSTPAFLASIISVKSKFLILIFALLIVVSCNTNQKEIERLQEENISLQQQVELNSQNVESYFSDLNQIEDNLRLIKQTENIISRQASGDVELGVTQQERINDDIKMIGELMEKNRLLIASLNNRIRNADTRIKGFEQTIERLNQTLQEKEVEIELMRTQLATMNLRVDFLSAKVDTLERDAREKSRRLEQQTMELNTAYYAIGSRRELTDNKIISREGGFLGIGRSERLKADFNHDFFTRVDITRVSQITINGQRPELITTHPADSYEIKTENGETFLEIKKPESFWSASRYLVIQVR